MLLRGLNILVGFVNSIMYTNILSSNFKTGNAARATLVKKTNILAEPPSLHLTSSFACSRFITMSAGRVPRLVTDREPKRVILRLRYNEFTNDDSSYKEAIEAYLTSIGRKVDELKRDGTLYTSRCARTTWRATRKHRTM